VNANEYHFVTHWRVEGTAGEIADVLGDPLALPRWWPSVYLDVQELRPGDQNGIGRRVKLHTKGWLPYTLKWEFETIQSNYPHGFSIVATGDFDGRGVWTIAQHGAVVDVTYDWRITAEKPLLRNLSVVLKPVFEANHRWAMARGEQSLKLELARRRATSESDRRRIPPPPGPITYSGVALIAAVTALAAGTTYLAWPVQRRNRPDE
jgi:hypothetical protein